MEGRGREMKGKEEKGGKIFTLFGCIIIMGMEGENLTLYVSKWLIDRQIYPYITHRSSFQRK